MQMLKGVAKSRGEPFAGAYVRLLGPSGEFVSEHRTRDSGSFRFHVVPGTWKLRWSIPGGRSGEEKIDVVEGQVVELDILLDEGFIRAHQGQS